MIGELRDKETMLAAIQSAETGHLVLGSIHCNDAEQTFSRILEFFPRDEHAFIRSSLANSLKAIMVQRLLPGLEEGKRFPATEVLLNNSIVKEKIVHEEDGDIPAILHACRDEGMRDFTQSLHELVEQERDRARSGHGLCAEPRGLALATQGHRYGRRRADQPSAQLTCAANRWTGSHHEFDMSRRARRRRNAAARAVLPSTSSRPLRRRGRCGSVPASTWARCGTTTKIITWWSGGAARGRSCRRISRLPASYPDEYAYALVVADGVGGEAFGEFASQLALETALELAGNATSWVMRLTDPDAEQMRARIDAYAEQIQATLRSYIEAYPHLQGMATTWTSAYVVSQRAIVSHVGDSRRYLFRQRRLKQITRDDTLAQQLTDAGSPAESVQRFRHVLTSSFGGSADDVHVKIYPCELQPATGCCCVRTV